MIDNITALISTLSLLLLLASAHALLSVIPPHSLININIRPSSRAAPVLNHERTSSSRKSTILYNNSNENGGGGFFGAIAAFFEELDAFVDDATSRRLGSGSAFYGKRKSNFYGKKDKNRKMDRDTPNPIEDYQGMYPMSLSEVF